jgi:hypothetical protein
VGEQQRQRAEKERLEWEAQLEAQRLKDGAEKTAKKLQEFERKEEEVNQERLRKDKEKKDAEKKKKEEARALKKAEKEKKEQEEILRGPSFGQLVAALAAEAQRHNAKEGTSQPSDPDPTSRIAKLADMCCKVHLSAKDTSGYKDLITAFVRLGLGEMLAAVMRKVGAAYIGISQDMFNTGIKVLDERDKLVHATKSAGRKSRGTGKNRRAEVHCTLRSTLMNMCKGAKNWDCRASFTNFMCALAYSITQGQDTDHLDNWRISLVTAKPWKKNGKKEGKGKEIDEMEGEEAQGAGPEEGEEKTKANPSKNKKKEDLEKNEHLYPGGRGILHAASDTHLKMVFECMLRIFAAGGFWLMPHEHAPFDENMVRGSVERPKCVLMKQVHEFVRKNLGVSASGEEEREYRNWWTLAENKDHVTEIFSHPTRPAEMGWLWIKVNPNRCAVSMAFTLAIVLEKNESSDCKEHEEPSDCKEHPDTLSDEDEELDVKQEEKGKRKVMDVKQATSKAMEVIGFLLALPAPPTDDTVSNLHEAHKRPRKARKKKVAEGHAAHSPGVFETMEDDVADDATVVRDDATVVTGPIRAEQVSPSNALQQSAVGFPQL